MHNIHDAVTFFNFNNKYYNTDDNQSNIHHNIHYMSGFDLCTDCIYDHHLLMQTDIRPVKLIDTIPILGAISLYVINQNFFYYPIQ